MSIVTFRSDRRALVETIYGVSRQDPSPAVVRVHANACLDEDARAAQAELCELLPRTALTVTASGQNLGFCECHNSALEALFEAGCEGVLVLNPDLVLADGALAELVAAAAAAPMALYGPVLALADPETLAPTGKIDSVGIRWTRGARHLDDRQGEPMTDLPMDVIEVAGISGACLFVPADAYHAIRRASGEFFDVDFFAYREDAELAYRAALLGVPSRLVPAARGLHVRQLRGTSRRLDPWINALGVRNRFLFAFKYGLRRPGGAISALSRDLVVGLAVLLKERSSLPALREAWGLRQTMRAKRARLLREIESARR